MFNKALLTSFLIMGGQYKSEEEENIFSDAKRHLLAFVSCGLYF